MRGKTGGDKVTIVASPGIADFGAWLEQLLAESTGKHGKGLIPVDAEPLGAPDVYGEDRVFVYVRLAGEVDVKQNGAVAALERAGHPVVRIAVTDRYHLGQEFFRWELATAVAGAILGINPFDQPDVEASKDKTRELTTAYEKSGALPAENTGVFLQITCDDPADLQVPDQKYTFGVVKAAQARGDFEALAERGRRALRIHLGSHVAAGLTTLKDAVRQALA
jgi:hypothetical protein